MDRITAEEWVRAFHVRSDARSRFALEDRFFARGGPLGLLSLSDAQQLAAAINDAVDARRFPEQAVRAGELYAAALLQEILRIVVVLQMERSERPLLSDAVQRLGEGLTPEEARSLLGRFLGDFPPTPVFRGKRSPQQHLEESTDGVANAELAVEELVMLRLANENAAFARLRSLHDDRELAESSPYREAIALLEEFFADEPPLGPGGMSLFELLRAPLRASPTSLSGQLDYIRSHWSALLGDRFAGLLQRMLRAIDVINEERAVRGMGDGPPPVLDAASLRGAGEYERFTEDRSWMPRVVVIAKSTYVWLDQLSRWYQRDISRLDQIPDEELDRLAEAGFTGLWLIGLWERSEASRRIKHRRGQVDAVASAYALYDYEVAADLGGHGAYEQLRDRAWQRGIRLASDMVPNHVGIDGRWVVEHPHWFLQLDHPPYPGYSYTGPDLSSDPRVAVQIEDHYWDGTDAAVVFRRYDRASGEERFIYHGNDGTSMPWNDTAQLNYLLPEVREGVIQTILHVARMFPIIRFDAAMTLAKRHIQRLWFPPPGQGGAIPSRAQHGLTEEEFERAIPVEFWREVVDRVNTEMPDTLLLAEAFWMLEGYFVRTLGMHRVYNSAFMHMASNEDNAEYRQLMKNVLDFDPEILKRFVNFMNNPDEETAATQFGTGDKYIGVCTMMVTMPGLPMFGHGQIEGFTEKYGMEFRRAQWQETPDEHLVERHRREIFPLVHRREQFAQTAEFLLYDFGTPGGVDENVYAYSNRVEGNASLVVYHNSYAETSGWVTSSVPYRDKAAGATRSRHLSEGLGLRCGHDDYVVFREHRSNLEYIRSSREIAEHGLYVELHAYDCKVFLDVREVTDATGAYAALAYRLGGAGVPSIAAALDELRTEPLREAVSALAETVRPMLRGEEEIEEASLETDLWRVFDEAEALGVTLRDRRRALSAFAAELESTAAVAAAMDPERPPVFDPAWTALPGLWRLFDEDAPLPLQPGALPLDGAEQWAAMIPIVERHCSAAREWVRARGTARGLRRLFATLLDDDDVRALLRVHDHEGITWFDRDGFRAVGRGVVLAGLAGSRSREKTARAAELLTTIARAEDRSGYRLQRLLETEETRARAATAAQPSKPSARSRARRR
jgi:glycosidase